MTIIAGGSPARRRAAGSARGMAHADPFPPQTAQNYWQPQIRRFEFGRESFRLTALRQDRPNLALDPLVSQLGWQRQGAAPRTGQLSFYLPLGSRRADLVSHNDQIAIDVSLTGPHGPWYRMLRMAVNSPQTSVVAAITNMQLQTIAISQLVASKSSWHYGKDGSHPRGWTAQQITVDACRRFGAPVGRLPSAKTYLSPVVLKNGSAYDVIVAAWKQERLQTGRRFVIDDDQGALEVTEVGRPKYMLPLGPALAEAVLNSFVTAGYANAVEVHGKVPHVGTHTRTRTLKNGTVKTYHYTSHSHQAISVTVTDSAGIKRYGLVQKIVTAPASATSASALQAYGRNVLAHSTKPSPTIEFTHPGIPWVDVGDAILLTIPEIGFSQMVYVQSVSHSVAAGQYTMDVTVGYSDPWLEDQSAKVSTKNRRQKGLKSQTGSHYLTKSARPQTKKATVHAGRTH